MSYRVTFCKCLAVLLALPGFSSDVASAAGQVGVAQAGSAGVWMVGSPPQPSPSFAYVIRRATAYYTTGPQQGRPPDGTMAAGTKVDIVREAGSYTLVRTVDGVRAYVASDALKPIGHDSGRGNVDASSIVAGANHFALDLYQQLRRREGNLFFSPASISTAFAMTYAGARGDTEREMSKTMHFPASQAELHAGMKTIQSFWLTRDKKGGWRLNLANRLWGDLGYDFLPEFLAITRKNYGAELARLDISGKTEKSRQTINHWVEDQTENRIVDLIPSNMLSPDSRLVLTNAVYFKGDWSEPFPENRTKDEDFYLSPSDTVKVPLMHQQGRFRHAALDGLQILDLPYGDGSLSMVVLLPREVDGLPELEAKLTLENLQRWRSRLRREEVKVYLPRFTSTSQFELSSTLKAMGMVSAFDAFAADFSGMTGGRDLYISAAIHKAFVDVNEEGAEAAAATGITMEPTAALPEKPQVFRADHPFVFFIGDKRNDAILFLGRYVNPQQ